MLFRRIGSSRLTIRLVGFGAGGFLVRRVSFFSTLVRFFFTPVVLNVTVSGVKALALGDDDV
jgi:hypothetical protein